MSAWSVITGPLFVPAKKGGNSAINGEKEIVSEGQGWVFVWGQGRRRIGDWVFGQIYANRPSTMPKQVGKEKEESMRMGAQHLEERRIFEQQMVEEERAVVLQQQGG